VEVLFDVVIILLPASLGFFAIRDVAGDHTFDGTKRKYALLATSSLTFNIMVFYLCFFVGILSMRGQATLEMNARDFSAMLLLRWASLVGFVTSLLTILLAILSERSLARKLCIWASAGAMVLWPTVYLVASEFRADYLLNRR
jgi:hypothetical protein